MAPQLATCGWTQISTRWLYLDPVGADFDAVGKPMGVRGREQNRNTGMWGMRGGGRKLADESRSGSTWGKVVVRDQPSVTAVIVRLFFSSPLFYFLFAPFLFSLALSIPLPRSNPSNYSWFPPRLFRPPRLHVFPSRWIFIFGEIRDVVRGRWLPSQPLRRSSWPETSHRNLNKAMVSSILGWISLNFSFWFVENTVRFERSVIYLAIAFHSEIMNMATL